MLNQSCKMVKLIHTKAWKRCKNVKENERSQATPTSNTSNNKRNPSKRTGLKPADHSANGCTVLCFSLDIHLVNQSVTTVMLLQWQRHVQLTLPHLINQVSHSALSYTTLSHRYNWSHNPLWSRTHEDEQVMQRLPKNGRNTTRWRGRRGEDVGQCVRHS